MYTSAPLSPAVTYSSIRPGAPGAVAPLTLGRGPRPTSFNTGSIECLHHHLLPVTTESTRLLYPQASMAPSDGRPVLSEAREAAVSSPHLLPSTLATQASSLLLVARPCLGLGLCTAEFQPQAFAQLSSLPWGPAPGTLSKARCCMTQLGGCLQP